MAVQMDRMIGHAQITYPHAHAIAEAYRQRIDAGEHAAVPCHMLKFVISETLGREVPGSMS
jgi:hypothetical protein